MIYGITLPYEVIQMKVFVETCFVATWIRQENWRDERTSHVPFQDLCIEHQIDFYGVHQMRMILNMFVNSNLILIKRFIKDF